MQTELYSRNEASLDLEQRGELEPYQPYDRLDTDPVGAAFSYEFAAPENGNCFCGNFAGHPCANDLFIYSL